MATDYGLFAKESVTLVIKYIMNGNITVVVSKVKVVSSISFDVIR